MLYVGIEWEPQFTFLRYPQYSVHFKWTHGLQPEIVRQETRQVIVRVSPICFYDEVADQDRWAGFRITLDGDNIEVRTVPVPLCKLPEEIARSNHLLKQFTLWLASRYGPVGVFFPRTIWSYPAVEKIPMGTGTVVLTGDNEMYRFAIALTKHVNVSCIPDMLATKHSVQAHVRENHLVVSWRNKLCLTRQRLHLRVPYTWSRYHDLPQIVQVDECTSVCRVHTKVKAASLLFHPGLITTTHHTFQLDQDPILIGYSRGETYVDRGGLR